VGVGVGVLAVSVSQSASGVGVELQTLMKAGDVLCTVEPINVPTPVAGLIRQKLA
jgi:hypothetical protein